MNFIKKYFFIFLIVFFNFIFFYPVIFQNKIPLPLDALIGMYHPYRDNLINNYPNGYPFKNPLITDPVRQQYPYRFLAINLLKQGKLPLWNPYNFSGTPLISNIQSAVFYPLNLLFFLPFNEKINIFSFNSVWTILVMLQPILAMFFMYLLLKSYKLSSYAAYLGGITYGFCGFMIAWMEWNTVGHVVLWMPLILLSQDKLVERFKIPWIIVLIISEISMLLAGHLQISLYILIFSSIYLIIKILNKNKNNLNNIVRQMFIFFIIGTLILIISSIQLKLTWDFILLSARNFDLPNWQRSDWFIPWQHLLQFLAPDFFGNPATGNYWGVWNYGEFIGYIGLIPLVFSFFALIFRRDKKTLFFGTSFFICLFIALPNFFGKIPYLLNIPFIKTMQPSRILVLIDFCLAVLAALGFDYLLKLIYSDKKLFKKYLFITCSIFTLVFLCVWIVVLFSNRLFSNTEILNGLLIAKRNLILPTFLLVILYVFWLLAILIKKVRVINIIIFALLIIISLDLLRFANKFIPFSDKNLIYPQTKALEFIQKNLGFYRYLTTDRRILAPNVSTYYKFQSVDGYDPLYLKNYAEFTASWIRKKPDISSAQFARIITPENYDSFMTDLLGVKYILSLKDEISPKLNLVFQEGETRIYENLGVFPRVFLAEEVVSLKDKLLVVESMYNNQDKLRKSVYTDSDIYIKPFSIGLKESVNIIEYSENRVIIKAYTENQRLLVFTDVYYPDWKALVNNKETSIFNVDYLFRGVFLPKGESIIEFRI